MREPETSVEEKFTIEFDLNLLRGLVRLQNGLQRLQRRAIANSSKGHSFLFPHGSDPAEDLHIFYRSILTKQAGDVDSLPVST